MKSSESLEQELLRSLARQGARVPVPVFLAAVMIAGLAANRLPMWKWGSWLALVAIWLAVRWIVLRKLPTMSATSERRRLLIATFLSGVNGAIHASSLFFFPYLPEFERAIQSMVLLGLCAGSVATTAGYKPVLLAYLLPVLVPLSALWVISPGVADPGWIETSTAILIALLGAILIMLGHDAYVLFEESFDIRMERAALNRELQRAVEDAEEANRAKTRFLASASHDLRQPIQALSMSGAALTMRPLDPGTREIAEQINAAVQALGSELTALLDVSKLDAKLVPVTLTKINVHPLLARVASQYEPSARAKNLKLVLDCPDSLWIETDPLHLGRIVRNLLENAIKYTDAGFVSLAAASNAGSCMVTVADSGRGIPDREQARVFEEFYQIDNPERDHSRGLGLGLAIVQRLVFLLGIKLAMTSAPGEGTQFTLSIPLSTDEKECPRDDPATFVGLEALRVLVVDDEPSIRSAMKVVLEQLGCICVLADGTRQATEAARVARPDLALVDFRLRGGDDGIDTVRALRTMYPKLPATLVSGDTIPDRLQEAQAADIGMLLKPVALEALKEVLAEAAKTKKKETTS